MPCIDRNSVITGYVLRYEEATSDQRAEKIVARSGGEGGEFIIAGLTPYTVYSIQVSALNNDSQTGPFATVFIATHQDSEYDRTLG